MDEEQDMNFGVRVTLECHHFLTFNAAPPMLDDSVYCVRCQDMRTVMEAPPEWRIRCTRCTYSRPLGVARLAAEVAAARHRQKTGHAVRIYNGRRLVYTMGGGPSTPQHAGQRASGVAGRYAEEDTPF